MELPYTALKTFQQDDFCYQGMMLVVTIDGRSQQLGLGDEKEELQDGKKACYGIN